MEFTKIQKDFVEYFKNNNITYNGKDITEIFPEVSKPERKKIRVEIEYNDLILTDSFIEFVFKERSKNYENIKVTELPEVSGWTDADMNEYAEYYYARYLRIDKDKILLKFKQERESK